jgi:hypothetical protein
MVFLASGATIHPISQRATPSFKRDHLCSEGSKEASTRSPNNQSPPAAQRSPTAPPNPPKSVTCRGFVIAPRHVTEVPAADIPTARFRHYPERLLAGHRVILLGSRLTTNQFSVVRNRQRPTRQITLHLIAAFLQQERMLGCGLDSFRQDRQVQALAETNDCMHDCSGVVVVFQVANKDTIDLDFVIPKGRNAPVRR